MKKIILGLFFIFLTLPAFAEPVENTKPIEIGISFDWISKTQLQRDENIKQIQNILFNEKTILKYNKKEFQTRYKDFLKDKNTVRNYMEISDGRKEDEQNYYAGFFLKKGLLIAYGIQSKKNMGYVYYYDAMGNLRFIDIYSSSYPRFPYYSYQYNSSGKLIGTIYFMSQNDQYIFNPDKTFKGRWYKENMYNRKAKVILTRSNW